MKMKTNTRKVILAVILSCLVHAAQAQREIIRFEKRSATVEEVLLSVMYQTPYSFVIHLTRFNINRHVTLSATELPLDQVIDQILAGSGSEYEIFKHYIIIKQRVVSPTPPRLPVNRKEEREQVSTIPVAGKPSNMELLLTPSPPGSPSRFSFREIAAIQDKPPRFVLKTNLLQAATTTPNLGFEVGLDERGTLELSGGYNPWRLNTMDKNNRKLVYWIARAEVRYWSRERFNGHFFGAHVFHGQYNISNHTIPLFFDKKYRYEGNALGAGVSYGYSWILGRRWNIELTAGIGLARMKYKQYSCLLCDSDQISYKKFYVGPTRAGVMLTYFLEKNK